MSRIDNRGVGPTGPNPLLYQDAAELRGPEQDAAARTAKATGAERGASVEARARYWGRPYAGDGILSQPPLQEGMAQRPDGRELQQLLRKALQRHRSAQRETPPAEAERRMLATLEQLIDAQDRVALRLAKLTKA